MSSVSFSRSECNTSMELNSSVSVVAADGAAAVNSNGTGDNCQNHGAKLVSNWLGESEEEEDYEKKRSKKNDSATGSPRSFDSQSSLSIDESGSIRHRPIPKELKTDSKNLMEDDDDDLELDLDNDSTASSPSQQQPQQPLAPGGQQQLVPTSNLVAVDTLKKKAPTLKTDKKGTSFNRTTRDNCSILGHCLQSPTTKCFPLKRIRRLLLLRTTSSRKTRLLTSTFWTLRELHR